MNFTAAVYTPTQGLVTLHSAVRVRGVNSLTAEGVTDITATSGPMFDYLVGVAVPAAVMIVFFVGWVFSLICGKICCKGCCGKNVALLLFTAACCMSLVGWAMSLAGNVETTKGVGAMLDGITAVQNYARRVQNLTTDAGNFASGLVTLANTMNVECTNDANITFPLDDITGGLNDTINTALGDSGFSGQINQINRDADRYKDLVVQYVAWRETGTMVVIVVTMVILTIFMVTTVLRVMDSTPEQCRPCLRCSSRGTSCIVFLFGILLLLIIWIFVAIIHVIATVGADLCVPSINSNLNRLINEAVNKDYTTDGDPCLNSTFRNSSIGVVCYYQTCEGVNKLAELTDPIRTGSQSSADFLGDFRITLNDSITFGNTTVLSANCFPSMDNFVQGTRGISTLVNRALDLTTCPEINPVYASFLYSGLCNGLFGSLAFTYITAIIAAAFMMMAMSIFRIFDFASYEEGRLPEGEIVQGDYVKGNQLAPSGGPIVQPNV